MAVTLRQIQAFLAVAELGTFTKAAERLHMAQPALSQLVRDLEQALGIRLFDRTTRRVELTVPAVALGDVALLLADTPLGAALTIEGFLAPSRKGSSRLVVHIQQANRTYAGGATVVV